MIFSDYELIEVSVPKGLISSSMLFESLLSCLHAFDKVTVIEYSFSDGLISLHIHVGRQYSASLYSAIYAVFPMAEISSVIYKDYIPVESAYYFLLDFDLANCSIYPIKRYEQFEDRLTKSIYDPINVLFSLMSSLNGCKIKLAMKIFPDMKFRQKANNLIFYLENFELFFRINKLKSIFSFLFLKIPLLRFIININNLFSFRFSPDDVVTKEHRRESSLEGAIDKVNKLMFKVDFSCLICSDNNYDVEDLRNRLISYLKIYKQNNSNFFQIRKLCKANYRLIEKHYEFKGDFFLNSEEIATVMHLPGENVSTDDYNWVKSVKFPPPLKTVDAGNIIGYSNFRGLNKPIGLGVSDRLRHTYIIGKTGMGKSTLLLNMFLQDVTLGYGAALIDPHGDLVNDVLRFLPRNRINDVVLIESYYQSKSVKINLLEKRKGISNFVIISSVLSLFIKIFGQSWGPRLEYYLRNFVAALLDCDKTYTFLDLHRLFVDEAFCRQIVSELKDPLLKRFFRTEVLNLSDVQKREFFSSILNKLGQFTLNSRIRSIIDSPKSTLDLGRMMQTNQVLLLDLAKGKLGEDSSMILGAIFVSKFQIEAFSRIERNPFFLYIDEFQNFATSSFSVILSEARKYGLGLIVANQFLDQMDEAVMSSVFGNIGNLVVFQVGALDAEFFSKQFALKVEANDILNLGKYEAYSQILVDGQVSSVFSFRSGAPPQAAPFTHCIDQIRANSRRRYYR